MQWWVRYERIHNYISYFLATWCQVRGYAWKIECIIRLTDSWVTFNAIRERAKLDKSVKRWDASDKIAIELERNPPISSAMKNTKHTDSYFQKSAKYVTITSFLYYVIMILVTTKHLEKVPSEAMVSLLVAFCFV